MFSFDVNGKEYKVRFGYGVLCGTDLIDRIAKTEKNSKDDSNFQGMLKLVAELLLAGLQKKQPDFRYETEAEKNEALNKVYDLMDDYEDESTDENPQNGYVLFEKLQKELFKNGFLSALQKEEAKR
jgi:hypothetical protein